MLSRFNNFCLRARVSAGVDQAERDRRRRRVESRAPIINQKAARRPSAIIRIIAMEKRCYYYYCY